MEKKKRDWYFSYAISHVNDFLKKKPPGEAMR